MSQIKLLFDKNISTKFDIYFFISEHELFD